MENFANRLTLTTLGGDPSCEKSVPNSAETLQQQSAPARLPPPLHSFHIAFTTAAKEDVTHPCKTQKQPRLSAQLLGQFIEQPVQIFIVLADSFNLLDGVQNRGVMLSAELPADFRQ